MFNTHAIIGYRILFIFYKVKILWSKHQISNNKVITIMFDGKPPNGLWH